MTLEVKENSVIRLDQSGKMYLPELELALSKLREYGEVHIIRANAGPNACISLVDLVAYANSHEKTNH